MSDAIELEIDKEFEVKEDTHSKDIWYTREEYNWALEKLASQAKKGPGRRTVLDILATMAFLGNEEWFHTQDQARFIKDIPFSEIYLYQPGGMPGLTLPVNTYKFHSIAQEAKVRSLPVYRRVYGVLRTLKYKVCGEINSII